MTTSRLRGMSRLTFLRLCVRAPRMRIVSMGQSANIPEQYFPAPLPISVNSPARMSAQRAASRALRSPRSSACACSACSSSCRSSPSGPRGGPGWDPAARRHRPGRLRAHPGDILQIPFGWLSDRFGPQAHALPGPRRSSPPAASSAPSRESPGVMILGRIVQGTGAISGVAIATVADLTREIAAHQGDGDHRLDDRRRLRGLVRRRALRSSRRSACTASSPSPAALALAAMAVVRWLVPDAPAVARAPGAVGLPGGIARARAAAPQRRDLRAARRPDGDVRRGSRCAGACGATGGAPLVGLPRRRGGRRSR